MGLWSKIRISYYGRRIFFYTVHKIFKCVVIRIYGEGNILPFVRGKTMIEIVVNIRTTIAYVKIKLARATGFPPYRIAFI